MPNIEIKETEYYNCPYCHRVIPNYAICNCAKIYNQALEDFFNKCKTLSYKESLETDSTIYFDIVELEDIKQAIDELKR